jgi:hypothetical protein
MKICEYRAEQHLSLFEAFILLYQLIFPFFIKPGDKTVVELKKNFTLSYMKYVDNQMTHTVTTGEFELPEIVPKEYLDSKILQDQRRRYGESLYPGFGSMGISKKEIEVFMKRFGKSFNNFNFY